MVGYFSDFLLFFLSFKQFLVFEIRKRKENGVHQFTSYCIYLFTILRFDDHYISGSFELYILASVCYSDHHYIENLVDIIACFLHTHTIILN